MAASDRARRLVQGDTGTTSGTQVWFGREANAYQAGVAAGRAQGAASERAAIVKQIIVRKAPTPGDTHFSAYVPIELLEGTPS